VWKGIWGITPRPPPERLGLSELSAIFDGDSTRGEASLAEPGGVPQPPNSPKSQAWDKSGGQGVEETIFVTMTTKGQSPFSGQCRA